MIQIDFVTTGNYTDPAHVVLLEAAIKEQLELLPIGIQTDTMVKARRSLTLQHNIAADSREEHLAFTLNYVKVIVATVYNG